MTKEPKDDRGRWARSALISAAGVALIVIMMATTTETPRPAVAILQYVLLACALVGLIGSAAKYLSAK